MKNLSKKAVEGSEYGGFTSRFYEDGVDDFRTDIPSLEKRRRQVDDALLEELIFYRAQLLDAGWDEECKTSARPIPAPPPIKVWKRGEKIVKQRPSYQDVFHWVESLDPVAWDLLPSDELSQRMSMVRALLKKQIAVDLLDDMEELRGRIMQSEMGEEEIDEFEKDYSRSAKRRQEDE